MIDDIDLHSRPFPHLPSIFAWWSQDFETTFHYRNVLFPKTICWVSFQSHELAPYQTIFIFHQNIFPQNIFWYRNTKEDFPPECKLQSYSFLLIYCVFHNFTHCWSFACPPNKFTPVFTSTTTLTSIKIHWT